MWIQTKDNRLVNTDCLSNIEMVSSRSYKDGMFDIVGRFTCETKYSYITIENDLPEDIALSKLNDLLKTLTP